MKLFAVCLGLLLLPGCVGTYTKNEAGITISHYGLPGTAQKAHTEASQHCASYGKNSLLTHENHDGDFPVLTFECK